MNLLFLLQAGTQAPFDFTIILLMMGIFLVVQFVIIGPKQKKKEKEMKIFLEEMQPNTPVILTSGIYGKFVRNEGEAIIVEIATGVKVKAMKSSINFDATKSLTAES